MSFYSQTRASARALVSVVLTGTSLGAALGGILGGAYLAGGYAQAASTHARVSQIAGVASGGYSDADLQRVVDRMDPAALRIAQRHDPFTSAGSAQRDRQAALFAARLERRDDARVGSLRAEGLRKKASFGSKFTAGPAAAPFRLDGALEASRDIECLTQAIYYEARGETPAGQAAVAQVVLNRVRHPAFPKTVCGVVFQGAFRGGVCQFSFACDGSMRKRREGGAWARAERVATRALSGEVMGQVGNATHFHTIRVAPSWGPRMVRVAQVGLHIFYRFGGRSGAPGAFDVKPEPSLEPVMGDRPLYAGATPETPVPYATIAPAKDVVFIAATAVAPKPIEVVASVPASAPGGVRSPDTTAAPKPVPGAKPVAAPATAAQAKPAPVKTSTPAATATTAQAPAKPAAPQGVASIKSAGTATAAAS